MAPAITASETISRLRSINTSCFDSEAERQQALQEAYSLVSRLENPVETSARLCLNNPISTACIKIALDLKLFHAWLSKNDGEPCSIKELQDLVPQCDPTLLMRVLRHLATTNILQLQVRDDNPNAPLYKMTPFTHVLIKKDLAAQTEAGSLWSTAMLSSLPKYFEKIQYVNPQYAPIDPVKNYTGGLPIWEYLQANEGWANVFSRLMKATQIMRGNLMSFLEDLNLTCDHDEDVLVVDVGGSKGHDLLSFRETFPQARGRLILQDLPHVIESIPPDTTQGIEKMPYDFFTSQPIKGAKGYIFHSILHDWPDTKAELILKTVADAMEKDSKLLILEQVIKETNPTLRETTFDWLMMVYGNGMERTEDQWHRLIESAGLRIKNIKRSDIYTECLIEVEKV